MSLEHAPGAKPLTCAAFKPLNVGKNNNNMFSLLDNPSSMADLEANLTRTMNNLAQNAKELEVY